MNPRLVVLAGPLEGTVFPLTEEVLTVGRETTNLICIPDPLISRRHCNVTRHGDQVRVSDLESVNGTFVNDVPVKEHLLRHGDRIAVGESLLLFLRFETNRLTGSHPVHLEDLELKTQAMVELRREDAVYLRFEKETLRQEGHLPQSARMARALQVLLQFSTSVNAVGNLTALQKHVLDSALQVVPAERGAVVLFGKDVEDVQSVYAANKPPGGGRPISVSRTLVRQVVGSGNAFLCNEIHHEEALKGAVSLAGTSLSSLLCVPLTAFDRTHGVLYLDTSNPTALFDMEHLQLVTAFASIAAVALENVRRLERLQNENQRLHADIAFAHSMVGESVKMQEVYRFISKVAPTGSTVLIRGESGTGKELVARALHLNSPRASKPFLAINCAVLAEHLLESDLFGHEKGAFTGAMTRKQGKFEVADGGTIFLDEIGEMSPTLQAKLLRVLQEREFERVGGLRPIPVDVRVLAATNRDLEEAVKTGLFRQDLYYRLNVISLTMPPLRERREDIPVLASFFAAKYSRAVNWRVTGISSQAMRYLTNYDWPGNVRELQNAVERAVVLSSSEYILPEDLPESVLEAEVSTGAAAAQYHEAVADLKKTLILRAVEQAFGNYTEAAKLLGVHPNYLHRLIRNLNLKTLLRKEARG